MKRAEFAKMSHIFISYSRKNSMIVEKIVDALTEGDLKPWLDWKSIPKGEEVQREIYQAIEEADIFLFFVSPDSTQSKWCIDEIEHAARNNKRILPVFIRDTDKNVLHSEISKRNWILCREGQDDFDEALKEICKTIHTDYEWLKYHTELQVKALKWDQRKDNSRLLRGKELREAEEQLAGAGSQKDPQPTELQRGFIVASQKDEKQRAIQTRVFSIIFLIVAVAAIVAGSILFDRTPAKVSVDGQVFEIRNRFNYRFLKRDVGSTISFHVDPQELIPKSGPILIVGTNTDGQQPGTVLAYDMQGNIQWQYSVDQDPYEGPPGNFKITNIMVDEILGNGQSQIIFTAQKSDWYPTELVLLDAEGKLLGSYWNSGFIYAVLRQDFDGDGIKELVVSAVNNNLGYLVVNESSKHPVTVFVLSPKEGFTGQAFPDLIPDIPAGTEYSNWVAVFEPYVVGGILLRMTEEGGKSLIEVVFNPHGGYIWLDANGRIQRVGLSDYWQTQQEGKSPADFICFLTHESDGWYISAKTDQAMDCSWYVR
jgi:hypothetical protein